MDKLRMKFLALDVDFDGPSFDFLDSRKPAQCARGHQRAAPPRCMLVFRENGCR